MASELTKALDMTWEVTGMKTGSATVKGYGGGWCPFLVLGN